MPGIWEEMHRMCEEQPLPEGLQEPHQKSIIGDIQGDTMQREQYITDSNIMMHQIENLMC